MRKICIVLLLIVLCFIMVLKVSAEIIVNDSYCTIDYESDKKLKVGITYNDKTTYYDYKSSCSLNYPFDKGNGEYAIYLYEQICGNKYKLIEKEKTTVELAEDSIEQYLISTYEINFSKNGVISKTASKLCKKCISDWERVFIIKNHVDKRISYDYDFAQQIENKIINTHIPNPLKTWRIKKGICYDIASLFAAMCRSQDIPCVIKKGYINDAYHAWNEVYIDGEWYSIDVKQPVSK